MDDQLARFRTFNRFYTSLLGLLDRHYLNSEFSLTEVRILYELNHTKKGITAKELAGLLQLDKGYLSRILKQFEKKKLIKKEISREDARSALIHVTEKGETVFKPLDKAAQDQASEILKAIPPKDVKELLASMASVQTILKNAR